MSMDRSPSLAIPAFVLVALAIIVAPMVLRTSDRRQRQPDRPVTASGDTKPLPSAHEGRRDLVSQEEFQSDLPPVPEMTDEEIAEREQKLDAALVSIASTYDEITLAQSALALSRIEEAQLSDHVTQLDGEIMRLSAELEQTFEAQAQAQSAIAEFSATLMERRAQTRQIADAARKEAHRLSLDKIVRERQEREARRQQLGTRTDSQSEVLHTALLKRRARQDSDLRFQQIVRRDETEIASVLAQRIARLTDSEQLQSRLTTERDAVQQQLATDHISLTTAAIKVAALTTRSNDLRSKLGTLSELKQNRESAVPIARLEERRRRDQIASVQDREQALFAPRTSTEFGVWRPAGFSPLQDSPVFVTRQIAHQEQSPVATYNALHGLGRVAAARREGVVQ